jgi:membrane protein
MIDGDDLLQENLRALAKRVKGYYRWVNGKSGGALGILGHSIQSFNDARASQAAASTAYYAIFSLFPLLLAIVAGGSFVLESDQVYQAVIESVTQALPTSEELIKRNIDQVLKLRGPVGLIGLFSLLWSGTGIFAVLAYNVNQAWPEAGSRNLVEKRLVALGMVGALVILLTLSIASTAAFNLLPRLHVPLWGGVSVYDTRIWSIVSSAIPWLFTLLLFVNLYRWIPNIKVQWSHAFWGGLVATLGWEIATRAFTWYLTSGMARYQLVYGSLGTVVALMFWIYLISLTTLFGAHVSAAVAQYSGDDRQSAEKSKASGKSGLDNVS